MTPPVRSRGAFMRDKIIHFIGGAVAAGAIIAVGGGSIAAFICALCVGIGKEAIDATGRGHVEALDAMATAAGGLLVAIAAS